MPWSSAEVSTLRGVSSAPSARSELSRSRAAAFSAVCTVAAVLLLDGAASALIAAGLIAAPGAPAGERPAQALVQPDGAGWTTTPYAEQWVPALRFGHQPDAYRVLLLGGSMAMGNPFQEQGRSRRDLSAPAPGSLSFWLERALELRLDRPVEVVTLAGAGVDSGWVLGAVHQTADLPIDAAVVLACNNETGRPYDPARPDRGWLGRRPLARLVAAALPRGMAAPDLTRQSADVEQVLGDHLGRALDLLAARGVPTVVGVPPLRRRWEWLSDPHDPRDLSLEDPRCLGWIRNALRAWPPKSWPAPPPGGNEAEQWQAVIDRCPHPYLAAVTELRALQRGVPPDAVPALDSALGACVADGIRHYYAGEPGGAARRLQNCSEPAARYWLGLALWDQGLRRTAGSVIDEGLARTPGCRCLSSTQSVIRAVAAERGLPLADLQADFEQWAGEDLTGPEQFVDRCHLTWEGYGRAAESIAAALLDRGPALSVPDIRAAGPDWGLDASGRPTSASRGSRP